jgi:hypothetical protein
LVKGLGLLVFSLLVIEFGEVIQVLDPGEVALMR